MANQNLEAFGIQLAYARRKAGYEKASDFVEALKARGASFAKAYYSHEAGERLPKPEAIDVYAEMLGVPKEHLLSALNTPPQTP